MLTCIGCGHYDELDPNGGIGFCNKLDAEIIKAAFSRKCRDKAQKIDAIFSLKPHFASAILDGTKSVELRTVAPKKPIERCWIYATAPVQQIVGYFRPGEIRDATPEDRKRALVGSEEFHRFFAIEILEPTAITPAIRPRIDLELGYRWLAPQSFRYCGIREREALRGRAP
jgi:hypothetical protein